MRWRDKIVAYYSIVALLLAACICFAASDASAQVMAAPHCQCTTDPQCAISPPQNGIVSAVLIQLTSYMRSGQQGFQNIVTNSGFRQVATAALIIYIATFGAMFTLGMVKFTLHDFTVRVAKIGVVCILLSSYSWDYFNTYVVTFFSGGTLSIISNLTINLSGYLSGAPITVTGAPGSAVPYVPPFAAFDYPLALLASPNMAMTLCALFTTPPFGPLLAILMIVSGGSFLKSMLTAITVYVMSLAMQALLFSVAPIFIICILFTRTRHLFDGWLNQVINSCLQPIILFTFYTFFTLLIIGGIVTFLGTPVCYVLWKPAGAGDADPTYFWRFWIGIWPAGHAYEGSITDGDFPESIANIMLFLGLVHLGSRFNEVSLQIAQDFAGASTSLASLEMPLANWFKSPTA